MTVQTHRFEAEVNQVLRLVINSLYSNKEIFLRELLSNASDALDKLRFQSLTNPELLGNDPTLEIRVRVEKDAGALVLEDTGIGMTEEELVKNLGTVAHSGTKKFVDALGEAKKDVNVIGQFGVGFYSSYLVANKVEVITRAAGKDSKALKWTSEATDGFTVEPATREARGTEIWLFIKPEAKEFLDEWSLRSLVSKYSDYVGYPIKIQKHRTKKDDAGNELEDITWDQVNQAKALWMRPKSEITETQYSDFYKHLTHDWQESLAHTHFKVEGTQEFVGLLYLPKRKPFDLMDPRAKRGVQLFVKRVFILDNVDELLPSYLRFMRGIVDSDDLPLNVSRELLQDSAALKTIKKGLTKKVLDMLEELAKDKPEDYKTFFKEFGTVLKEGLAREAEGKERERLVELLRFETTKEEFVSLDTYVGRMQEKQEAIYYIQGESKASLVTSPYLESLRSRGYEVFYMTDVIDEWAVKGIGDYKDKKLVSAMRTDLKFEETEETKKAKEEASKSFTGLFERATKVLEKAVKEVRVSDRLTDSPCCLVVGTHDASAYIEKVLRENGQGGGTEKRILEVNPNHPLIKNLQSLVEKDPASPEINEWIETLYDQALLMEGGTPEDPNKFARRVTDLLTKVSAG